jgi:hypothetical protein
VRDLSQLALLHRRWGSLPSIEPGAGRCDVEPHGWRGTVPLAPVLAHIQQNVRESVPDLARRPQRAQVVAAEQHRPLPPEHAIHGSREPRCHRLHSARECFLAVGLDHHVQVVALDRVMAHAELAAFARRTQADSKFRQESAIAQ